MIFRLLVNIISPLINGFARIAMMNNAMSYARASNLKGDYTEFGVWKGNMFALAYHCARKVRLGDMRFYAFDSFEGLPPSASEYELKSNTFWEGRFAFSEDKFKKAISKKGVDLKRVVITKGWFEKSLTPQVGLGKVAVALIDCDLYESAKPVLEYLSDKLVNGAVLIFDDWFLFEGNPDAGVQKACNEWLNNHPEIKLVDYHKYGWHGNSFIVRCKNG